MSQLVTSHRSTPLRLARKRLAAVLLFAFIALVERDILAEEPARTEPWDTVAAEGLLARARSRLASLDWGWFGGGGGSGDSTAAASNPDTDCRSLEAYYGCRIDSIVITGNTRTKPISILREMASKRGGVLEERLVRRDSAYLRGMGYFADVRMTGETVSSDLCRLHVHIVERPAIFMSYPYPVVNYDFQRGLSYGVTWKIKNFRGLGENFGVSTLMRKDREESAGFFWNSPWFLGRRAPLWFDANAYRSLVETEDPIGEYVKEQVATGVGFGLPLTKDLLRQLWLMMDLTFERRKSRLVVPNKSGVVAGDLYFQNFISVGTALEYDSRDDHRSAYNGMHHRIGLRKSQCVRGLRQNYMFYRFSDYFYIPTGTNRSFIIGVDGDIREGDTPAFYDMKLGGVRDLRGFADDEVRGKVKLVSTLQYRAELISPRVFRIPRIGTFDFTMNWVAFIDNGALMDNILDAGGERFHTTGGIGFEIMSPFRDLIRLEMASDGRNSPAFYMTAGTDF